MPKTDHIHVEQERHRRAFELYCSLEGRRTYSQVAQQVGVSLATIKRWAKVENWQNQARDRDAALARQLADRFATNRLAKTERNLKIVQAAIISVAKDIAEGRIKSQLSDLPRLIQLERELSGDPSVGGKRSGQSSPDTVLVYMPDNGRGPRREGNRDPTLPLEGCPGRKRPPNDTAGDTKVSKNGCS